MVAIPLVANVLLALEPSAVLYIVVIVLVNVKLLPVLLIIVTTSPAANTLLGIVTVPLACICLPESAATRV